MATTARQPKPQRKGMPEPGARRAPAWGGARASPTFSPGNNNARLPNGPPAATGAFPPLGHPAGNDKENPHDRILAQLIGLTTHIRYEGTIASTSGEGDTTGVTLRDVKDLSAPGAPLKETLFIAATNIEQWSSGPADAKAPTTTNGDSFKTDTDISKAPAPRRERELLAWADDIPGSGPGSPPLGAVGLGKDRDEQTFGPGANGSGWNQFEVNERLFGVKAGFDEEAYTTKLDRNAPDYKERERRAAAIANEIMQSTTNNVHIAEERVQNLAGDSVNEEERYGAVVRGANAYVPPGARKTNSASPGQGKQEVPKVAVNAPDGSAVSADKTQTGTSTPPPKATSPAPGATQAQPAADAVPAFRSFVSNEKDRLLKKKQALMKNEMDKRMAELVKFSQSFKLNKPIPDDLVPILAKDEDKQRQIREKSTKDAESAQARAIGTSGTAPVVARAPPVSQATMPLASGKPLQGQPITRQSVPGGKTRAAEAGKGRPSMFIQAIPPFKGKRTSTSNVPVSMSVSSAAPSGATSPLSPTAVNRLNVNASSFRPTVKSISPPVSLNIRMYWWMLIYDYAMQSGSPNLNGHASPKPKPGDTSSQGPPNPFFGTRLPKKGMPVHIKEDFNPFRHNKVADAAQVSPTWPYNGKRYMQMFPPLQTPPQQQSPPMAHPPPPPMPPPQYEDDPSAGQVATRGPYMYPYPPYYPGQPMMPGMGPPPPGAYMPPPFMHPMQYPHMPPNAMYGGAPMGQMPPPQAYLAPPPGAYPAPPNGAGPRPSMPPTPIPSHANPYYHQSPQLQHAMPYPMMMPPPGPPHPYDGSQAPPVQMGGVGHA
ncbi:hypothetical protein POSPLADRAFT_1067357 [Postia placenta MAD-698-R-SB12]|uniref:LsmAD domain-containing protein n=1 Tax=Postia placenta MAD-698-R-SB12 TaxID=670580 RepID=A0A1X6MRN6_9APHY|nr:hypothetical protein POSPLADRAFT_1067357 [Postia placenta MAD-698-R-SB12]OSX58862.1 hypothetical protein POSPLADRAFT_1067357 [Postia placenta MAD-698-R-SB12]